MLTITVILVLAALSTAIVAAMGKCPLWIAVILLAIVAAIGIIPLK